MYAKGSNRTEVVDRREMVRIKLKTLAYESTIIRESCSTTDRRGRARNFGPLEVEMRKHRLYVVRHHARLTSIAYGLIRGKALDVIEAGAKCPLDSKAWASIDTMCRNYGPVGMHKAPISDEQRAAHGAVEKADKAPKARLPHRTHDEWLASPAYQAALPEGDEPVVAHHHASIAGFAKSIVDRATQPKSAWPFPVESTSRR